MQWTTEFSVIARHHARDGVAPILSRGHCVLAVEGDVMMLACERPDGTVVSKTCSGAEVDGLLLLHDMLAPRLRLVTPPSPDDGSNVAQRMMMFNAPRLRAIK